MKNWYLEGYSETRHALQRIPLNGFPFRVGRAEGLSLVLDSDGISREHAELRCMGDHLVLLDLNSTNGTFLNREPVKGEVRIENGDIIHFAEREFRVVSEDQQPRSHQKLTRRGIAKLSDTLPSGGKELHQLMLDRQVDAVFQPIVRHSDGRPHAWEVLGRGRHPKLPESPGELFSIAESLGLAVQFSELLRRTGVARANEFDPGGTYFTNIHPQEVTDTLRLLESMDELRRSYPSMKLAMEIHEAAVADKGKLQAIRDYLHERDILLAYDDFGRGQARMLELADVPPDYVKLDKDWITDIDKTSSAKQQMVKMFAGFAHEHGIIVVAEGVNSDAEIEFCTALGIDLFQGYRFGEPVELKAPA